MATAGKKSKRTHESINNRLALVMKSGKYTLGYKTVLKTLRTSKGFFFFLSIALLLDFLLFVTFSGVFGSNLWWVLQGSWYWYLTTAHLWGNQRLSTMLCLLKLVFTISMEVSAFSMILEFLYSNSVLAFGLVYIRIDSVMLVFWKILNFVSFYNLLDPSILDM